MELKNIDNFAILLCNEANDEKSTKGNILKISLRQHIHFNWVKIDEMTTAVLYNVEKQYLYNFGANKKLKFVWKSADDFYIVDFSNNTKGNIISHLTFDITTGERIDGAIMYYNLKPEFKIAKKVPLVSSNVLDEKEQYTYEPFIIYMENNTSMDVHNQI